MKKLVLLLVLSVVAGNAFGMENESSDRATSKESQKVEQSEETWGASLSWLTHVSNALVVVSATRNLINNLRELYNYKINGYRPIQEFIQADSPTEIAQVVKNVYNKMSPPLNCYIKVDDSLGGPGMAGYKMLVINPRAMALFNEAEREQIVGHEFRHIYNSDFICGSLWTIACPLLSYGILKGYYKGSNYLLNLLQKRIGQKTALYQCISHLKVINAVVAHNFITQFLLSNYLDNKFTNFCELRADRESAILLNGATHMVSMLEKMQDPGFLARYASTMNVSLEALAAADKYSPYPISERIQALEKLINK